MQNSLEKIRDLCHQLAARKGLSDPARDELCAHLEDKLHGYLNGEVKITEEDALVLVRAHFGDAEKIAGQIAGSQKENIMSSWFWIIAWAILAVAVLILSPQMSDVMEITLGLLAGLSIQKIRQSDGALGRQIRAVQPWLLGFLAIASGAAVILPALAKLKQQHVPFVECLGPLMFGAAVLLAGLYLIALGVGRKMARRA